MVFTESRIPGVWVIDIESIPDARGFFATTWLPAEFERRGLVAAIAQYNVARSYKRGTLRGMHFQRTPHEQVKVIRCIRGALLDVVVDLRPGSPTYRRWDAVELTAASLRMLYVPEGLAHGYLTLQDDTEVGYQVSSPWVPSSEDGVRWDDPAFGIEWPFPPTVISEKDRNWPLV